MKKLNKKAFTLIELLAVIIILGVLMLIAIPSVTQYITNSRKSTYMTSANQFISSVSMKVNSNDGLTLTDPEIGYLVKVSDVPADKGCVILERGGSSPFGDWRNAYVLVTFNGTKWSYYFTGLDSGGWGLDPLAQSELDESDQPTAGYTSEGKKLTATYAATRDELEESASKVTSKTLAEIAGTAEKTASENGGVAYIKLDESSKIDGIDATTFAVIMSTDEVTNQCTYSPY